MAPIENMITTNTTKDSGFYLGTTSSDFGIDISGTAMWNSVVGNYTINYSNDPKNKRTKGIHPMLFFKYVKKKFGIIDGYRMDRRLKNLEKAFDKAVESGQEVLAEKFLMEFTREFRESALYAKGIKMFIEKEDLSKHKHKIRDGHISDTKYEDYTRIIPKNIIAKKKKLEGVFDGFIVYHYWNDKIEEKVAKKEKMSSEEKQKMRDPILFGTVRESNRLYFIDEWDDDECDLNFEEMTSAIGKDDKEFLITDKPNLKIK